MVIGATGSPLLLLAVLACPIGMGVMMLFMGRGMMGGKKKDTTTPLGDEAGSLADMKAEQARLAEKISALEDRQPQSPGAEKISALEDRQPQSPAAEREPNPVS